MQTGGLNQACKLFIQIDFDMCVRLYEIKLNVSRFYVCQRVYRAAQQHKQT